MEKTPETKGMVSKNYKQKHAARRPLSCTYICTSSNTKKVNTWSALPPYLPQLFAQDEIKH